MLYTSLYTLEGMLGVVYLLICAGREACWVCTVLYVLVGRHAGCVYPAYTLFGGNLCAKRPVSP